MSQDTPLPTEPLKKGHRWYEVYAQDGFTIGFVQARNKLEADVRAEHAYGDRFGGTAQTEI